MDGGGDLLRIARHRASLRRICSRLAAPVCRAHACTAWPSDGGTRIWKEVGTPAGHKCGSAQRWRQVTCFPGATARRMPTHLPTCICPVPAADPLPKPLQTGQHDPCSYTSCIIFAAMMMLGPQWHLPSWQSSLEWWKASWPPPTCVLEASLHQQGALTMPAGPPPETRVLGLPVTRHPPALLALPIHPAALKEGAVFHGQPPFPCGAHEPLRFSIHRHHYDLDTSEKPMGIAPSLHNQLCMMDSSGRNLLLAHINFSPFSQEVVSFCLGKCWEPGMASIH